MQDPLIELLKMFKEQISKKEYTIQVATMNPESKAVWHNWERERDKGIEEIELLYAKAQVFGASLDAQKREAWNKIYKIHSLPVDGHYEVRKDVIMMAPKEKQA